MTKNRNAFSCTTLTLVFVLLVSIASYPQNQVLGEVQFVTKTKTEKTSGVWIDGQYVGYAKELKDEKKVLLLPGEHEISVRQSGYMGFYSEGGCRAGEEGGAGEALVGCKVITVPS